MPNNQEYVGPETLRDLRAAISEDDYLKASEILESLRLPDRVDIVQELEFLDKTDLLVNLPASDAANILEKLPDKEVVEVVLRAPRDTMIDIINEMEPDEAADLIEEMPWDEAAAIMGRLTSEADIKRLISYPPDTAGSIMTTQPPAIRHNMTAGQALDMIHAWTPDRETLNDLFAIDGDGRLAGVVSLFQLIQAPRQRLVSEFMETSVIQVTPEVDVEICAGLFQRYSQITLPVVDDEQKIIGVIMFDDLIDVVEKEVDEDMHHLGGTRPLEDNYLKTRIVAMVGKRAMWLLLLFGAAILTTSIMAAYKDEVQAVAALAVFVPLLIGTGGNSGAQTTTTVIRALAAGEIQFKHFLQVWFKEIRVGLLLGLTMSLLSLLLSFLMFKNAKLSLTVGVSIFFIILTANFVGAILPISAKRLGLDPTLLSAPMISTTVDAVGLIIYFSTAKIVLGL